MGYTLLISKKYNKPYFFQFPLWDTRESIRAAAKKAKFFQFPLWDTIDYDDDRIRARIFQFPLWDTFKKIKKNKKNQ